MLNSMTGFASLSGDTENARWDWEIRSVNGKGLDLRLRMPDSFDKLEPLVRAEAKKHLSRGNVTVVLKYAPKVANSAAQVDQTGLDAALRSLATIDEAAQVAGVNLAPMTAADVAQMPGVLNGRVDTGAVPLGYDDIAAQVPEIFAAFAVMRAEEGAALDAILSGQLDSVADIVAKSAVTAEARAARQGDILREKVAVLVDATTQADPARLQQELAVLAVKSDVTEEVDRLDAHVEAARGLLKGGGAIGRKLDFLMQEFNREANTLCSKSGSTELTTLGVELKVLIDQMREQVQNLE